MALPREYTNQACSMVRALEIVGERWTLLIVRDAVFGVRRFSDFVEHLGIPRAVLSERLEFLLGEGVLERVPGTGKRSEYEVTGKGRKLWPVIRTLSDWGDEYYAPDGPRRVFVHASCAGEIATTGECLRCGTQVPLGETLMTPGPGLPTPSPDSGHVTTVLAKPRPLLRSVH
ncbi:winged helix-turn-helix transcriptional regulator [Amycolatopsis jiangsuensis]|uniref:DNA-binding HxlR family transcriptional regulator n=1 Tax=Amycolatopsis jiangsuensis TaxID=1181879 RepID=A0A840IW54_9PSEU|nr:helix-turn-helix domain-containing protein [Amycolatopsis jiangsuensis]MBB4686806.1 DNA-binding HxlR family transcriptional regulator [Amycolatopsis jiangsuensis]